MHAVFEGFAGMAALELAMPTAGRGESHRYN